MSKTMWFVTALLLAAGFAVTVGCGSDSKDEEKKDCPVGSVGCPCSEDKCNGDLECVDNVCVEPTVDSVTETESEEEVDASLPPPSKLDIYTSNMGDGEICAEGVVVGPEDESGWGSHWGAGFGINLCQEVSNGDKIALGECPRDMSRLIGFRLTVTGDKVPSELRIQFDDTADEDNGYIVLPEDEAGNPVEYLLKDVAVLYLDEESRPELDTTLFTSLQFQIASHLAETEEYSFCVKDIEAILSDEAPDGGVPDGGVADTGAADTAEAGTDTECDSPTAQIIPNKDSGWTAACSNIAGIQGDMYHYSDPGK